jgi:hypothetical protein
MSQPSRALAISPAAPSSSDEQSGVRYVPRGFAEACALEEKEALRLREEAAELIMFEWHMFLTELEPPVADPIPARAPAARRRAIWPLALGVLYAAMVATAATPTGADAFASALTAGHADQVRHAVHEITAFVR